MMYHYMTLRDETNIVHSHLHEDGTVRVYLERPDAKDGFHHATCYLPGYQWENVSGFTEEEMKEFDRFLHANAHLIVEFAKEGGFADAAGF